MPPAGGQESQAISDARSSEAHPNPASATDMVAEAPTDAHLVPPAQLLENAPLIASVRSLSVFDLHEPIVPIDDGKGVVQAWAGNGELFPVFVKPCRSYQLVREVLCNLLANALGLPVPRAVLLDVSSSPEGRHLLELHGEGKFAFGVERRGVDLRQVLRRNRRTEDMLLDWPLLPRAIAFDEWVGNEDRTAGNLLFEGRGRYLLIDHEQALPTTFAPTTKIRNGLAEHAKAVGYAGEHQVFAERVKDELARFASVSLDGIRRATLGGAWKAEPELSECIRLLEDRLPSLPSLVDQEFASSQGRLL